MILAHRLMSAGQGNGVYIALPTMATANAMYQRMANVYSAFYRSDARPSLVLAHGGRHMSRDFSQSIWGAESHGQINYHKDENSAVADCNIWFADSRKKALLAEVGVGTLDQALMAVMPFRHQSLRVLGLRNKLLIADEIHSYDPYMSMLLESLLQMHAAQGGSAILLTATLPQALRQKWVNAFYRGLQKRTTEIALSAGYPWFTHANHQQLTETQLATRKEVERSVHVAWFNDPQQGIELIRAALKRGQCIGWVRNSVDDAIAIYQQLQGVDWLAEENLLLFHSRFAFVDRMDIEEKTLQWFGKQSTPEQRQGKVLIATQVIEQSLDLDLDVMLSDLAPIDLLIQRAGRLQRHIRDHSGRRKTKHDPDPDQEERSQATLYVLAPEWRADVDKNWLDQILRHTGYVYPDHARLWHTQTILRQQGQIKMPDEARLLIERVYANDITAPLALEKTTDTALARSYTTRSAAQQNTLNFAEGYSRAANTGLWGDEVEISTRLGERTIDVYLAYLVYGQTLPEPYCTDPDFPWEKSRLAVREGWWQKRASALPLLTGEALELFRQRLHRPKAQVLIMQRDKPSVGYSSKMGLKIKD